MRPPGWPTLCGFGSCKGWALHLHSFSHLRYFLPLTSHPSSTAPRHSRSTTSCSTANPSDAPPTFPLSGSRGGWPGREPPGRFWVPHTSVVRMGSWGSLFLPFIFLLTDNKLYCIVSLGLQKGFLCPHAAGHPPEIPPRPSLLALELPPRLRPLIPKSPPLLPPA